MTETKKIYQINGMYFDSFNKANFENANMKHRAIEWNRCLIPVLEALSTKDLTYEEIEAIVSPIRVDDVVKRTFLSKTDAECRFNGGKVFFNLIAKFESHFSYGSVIKEEYLK